ncbi:hypothetical protein GOP47_0005874 [Adiantum capillus-veneris]|uniref:TOG domain-containing protein n=1 Tax=Adiantum capillus-veneris TaxID=13818 RepID=A0A9D4ZJT2_ADICA|nr:hypothetical protein GOP47_0005874 [Adiantum capillus-veneris]
MALRSINSTASSRERRIGMKRGGRAAVPSVASGTNDENVDLLGSPNCLLPPPSRTCRSSPSPVCTDGLACRSSPLPAEAGVPTGDASVEVEYILSENLPHLDNPDDYLSSLLQRLDSKDWVKVCEAINIMRQLAIYHSAALMPLLEQAVPLLIKAMKNPRSALCKTAIMASADLLKSYPVDILAMLEQLLLQLLLKASQDKKFVCEEAERSLQVMTDQLAPAPLLEQLQPYVTHRNPRVRAKAASCVCRAVSKLGSGGIKSFGVQTLLQIAASQLNDQLPEARESARRLVAEVHAAYSSSCSHESLSEGAPSQKSWDDFCNTELQSHVAQAILRITLDC